MHTLTSNQADLKFKIAEAADKLGIAQRRLEYLKSQCKDHVVMPAHDQYHAECAVCGTDLGRWCAKSPTHLCECGNLDVCLYCGRLTTVTTTLNAASALAETARRL